MRHALTFAVGLGGLIIGGISYARNKSAIGALLVYASAALVALALPIWG
jgi:hypothetical protein